MRSGFIPSLVRLKPFDDYLRRHRETPYLHDSAWIEAVIAGASILVDREFGERSILVGIGEGENEMIEQATQVMDEITRKYRRAVGRGRRRVDLPCVLPGCRVTLEDNAFSVQYIGTSADFGLQALQMFPGPFAFEFDTTRYGHEVSSEQRQPAGPTDTEDPEGSENPGSKRDDFIENLKKVANPQFATARKISSPNMGRPTSGG